MKVFPVVLALLCSCVESAGDGSPIAEEATPEDRSLFLDMVDDTREEKKRVEAVTHDAKMERVMLLMEEELGIDWDDRDDVAIAPDGKAGYSGICFPAYNPFPKVCGATCSCTWSASDWSGMWGCARFIAANCPGWAPISVSGNPYSGNASCNTCGGPTAGTRR